MARKKTEEVEAERLEKCDVIAPCYVNGKETKIGDTVELDKETKNRLQAAGCVARNRMMTT